MTGARLCLIAGALAAGLLGLAACTPDSAINLASDPRTQQVDIGGDTYFVLIEDDVVTVASFETGMPDQLALMDGARAAIATQTDCSVSDFFKFKGINRYQARLSC